jgi:hypothetical protein
MGGGGAPSPPPPPKAPLPEDKEIDQARERVRIMAIKSAGRKDTMTNFGAGYDAGSAPVKMKAALGE